MDKLYLISGFVLALILPHLTAPSVSTLTQISLQGLFLVIGYLGFITFNE